MYRLALVVLLCLLPFCQAIQIKRHDNSLHLHSSSTTNVVVDSTWIIFVESTSTVEARIDLLVSTLASDDCTLLYSAIDERALLFKVYCPQAPNDAMIETILNRTRTEYLSLYFVNHDEVSIVKNQGVQSTSSTTTTSWHLDRIDQRTLPLDGMYHYLTNASDIDIYIIDSGIKVTHTEFEDRAVWLINTVDGFDTDLEGHGTFVASVAAGKTFGVAKMARLYAVKVLDGFGQGDLFTVQAGILQVIATSQANVGRRAVANLALISTKYPAFDKVVASLTANNIVVSVAAGNQGVDACRFSPAGLGGIPYTNVLTVGATDINDHKYFWSNDGHCVSISAPGVNMIAADIVNDTSVQTRTGTSMSTPLVAGVAALVLQQDLYLSVAEVKRLILAWATPNVVIGASVAGGGKNLLYSLINVSIPSVKRSER